MSFRPVTDVGLFARRKHDYYGGFFAGSLERMRLPLGVLIDEPVLFVCGGGVRRYPFAGLGPCDKTVDINRTYKDKRGRVRRLRPDYVMDVRRELPVCPEEPGGWRAMIVDPPWSKEQAGNYGTADKYPEPGPLLRRCLEHTRPGGRVGFLHWDFPRPPREVDGCRIKFVFGMPMGLYGETWRGYVVFEKVMPKWMIEALR